jgi:hypothetical protein
MIDTAGIVHEPIADSLQPTRQGHLTKGFDQFSHGIP